jgi:hypothetical protein
MPKTVEQLDRELQDLRATVKQALETFQIQIAQQTRVLQQLAALIERLPVQERPEADGHHDDGAK